MRALPPDKMKSTADRDWCLVPMGDCCLIIEFGVKVDMATNQMVHAVADYLQAHPPKGVIDIVPSFTAVALHYRPEALEHVSASPYQQLKDGTISITPFGGCA
jgi:inhibitor of KinA